MPSLLKRSHSSSRGKKSSGNVEWTCEVALLHQDKPLELKLQRDTLGEAVFAQVCDAIGNLEEKDYFGLLYSTAENEKKWLDLRTPAYKQLKRSAGLSLRFCVKHYPPSPTDNLKQDISKYLLFQQLKRDLLEGRLYSKSSTDVTFLAACIVQSEFGDYDQIEGHQYGDYLSGVALVHAQTAKLESRICEEHAALKGKTASEAEVLFLARAFSLDTYGIDPQPVRDRNGNLLFVGLSHRALVTFHGSKLTHSFPWESIGSIRVQDKTLILEVNLSSTKRHMLGFKCEKRQAAAALWAAALEQQMFFTLNRGTEARVVKSSDGILPRRRSSFKFSGRSQKELLSSSDYFLNLNQTAPAVVRIKRADSVGSCPTVRRLPSTRRRMPSSSSSGSDVSSVRY